MRITYLALLLQAIAISSASWAQNYPNKPIRILASDPGGGNDFAARILAQALTGSLGQQVIVDNRGGVLGTEYAAKATPDGYTLLLQGSVLWLLPFMRDNVRWDPVRDFAPVSLMSTSPNVIVTYPSLPAQSIKDLISLAKAKPGTLNYAIGGLGSTPHLAAELLKNMAGLDMVRVNYKGGGAAYTDLIAGQVHLMFPTAGSATPHLKSGRLKVLAVTSAKPSALMPGVPTVASAVPGYEAVTPYGVFAPAKTPAVIINRLNQEIVAILNRADVKERFFNTGVETVGSSPQQLAAEIKADMARMSKVIKDVGIRAD